MKKITLYFSLSIALFSLAQCKTRKETTQPEVIKVELSEEGLVEAAPPVEMVEAPTQTNNSDPIVVNPVKVYANYIMEKNDPYTLLGTRISGDTIFFNVQYGGGCEEHQFTLNTTGAWIKSMPPQLYLYLEHRANNDRCRALLTKEIAFDLSKTRYPGAKEVKLIINDNREQSVVYKYQ